MRARAPSILLLLWITSSFGGALGCQDGTVSDLGAGKMGDLSNPAAPHEHAGQALTDACGYGGLTNTGLQRVARYPYLQQMTASSVRVLLTTASGPPPELVVSRPDGALVGTVPMSEDLGAAGGSDPQWLATIEGLAPSTIYCYELAGLTARTGFKTAPERGSGEPVRFVVFGDSGTGSEDQRRIRDQMMSVPFDLMLHTGDVAYNSGRLSQLEAGLFDVYRELMAKVPLYPSLGNHDYQTLNGEPYLGAFSLAENGGSVGKERWYSFDWASVHFVALDTEQIGAAQSEWLERDLAANDLPWTVVYFHKPPFSDGQHGGDDLVRSVFVPIFNEYHVQLVLSGHDHDYERFKPKDGVHYVVTGGGGNLTRPVGWGSDTAFSEAVQHFVLVEVDLDRLLLHAIDGSGREFDSLMIRRDER